MAVIKNGWQKHRAERYLRERDESIGLEAF